MFTEAQVLARIASAIDEARMRWETEAEQAEKQQGAQLRKLAEDVRQQNAIHLHSLEREVVKFSLGIARKILQCESKVNPHLLTQVVHRALDQRVEGTPIKVRVNSLDIELWQDNDALAGANAPWTVVQDSSIQLGTCVVESDLGTASFDLIAQLEEIGVAMLAQLNGLSTQVKAGASEGESPGLPETHTAD